MSFVLSIVRPTEGEAGHGRVARVLGPVSERRDLRTPIYQMLRGANPHMLSTEASRFADQISRKECGTVSVEGSTGLRFRIDNADNAPHACSCCTRLVLPSGHPQADDEAALCLGCFTWDRKLPACLPENSAHPVKED